MDDIFTSFIESVSLLNKRRNIVLTITAIVLISSYLITANLTSKTKATVTSTALYSLELDNFLIDKPLLTKKLSEEFTESFKNFLKEKSPKLVDHTEWSKNQFNASLRIINKPTDRIQITFNSPSEENAKKVFNLSTDNFNKVSAFFTGPLKDLNKASRPNETFFSIEKVEEHHQITSKARENQLKLLFTLFLLSLIVSITLVFSFEMAMKDRS